MSKWSKFSHFLADGVSGYHKPFDVDCPLCGAWPLQPCRRIGSMTSGDHSEMEFAHRARRDHWNKRHMQFPTAH